MHHYRKTWATYLAQNTTDKNQKKTCSFPFCDPDSTQRPIYENKTMYVMPNRVAYDFFEGCKVLDHLMVIPKRHVESINDFTDQEKLDHMAITGDYEARGYSIYSRGRGSVTRSMAHQHTHLIKLGDTKPRAIVYLDKPYFLFHR